MKSAELESSADPQVGRPAPHLVAGMHSRGALPHLKREGGTYFVTFRLKGCLPAEVLQTFKAEREAIVQRAVAARRPLTWHEQQEVFRWYSSRVDAYLDAGHGKAFLCESHIAPIITSAIQFHESSRFKLLAWAVMPNHVHAVVHRSPAGRSVRF